MLPYFLLLAVPFLMYFVCVAKRDKGKKEILVGLGPENSFSNLAMPVFFLFLLGMLMFRAESVGADTTNYKYIFLKNEYSTLKDVFAGWEECLFSLLNYILYKVSDNYQVYLAFIALIQTVPLMYFYNKDRSHTIVKLALFVNMSTFVMMFSGIRQAIAVSIGVLAFGCIKKRRKILFFICATVAFLTHTSAFMIFLLYPVYHLRFKRKHLMFILPSGLLLLIFNRPVFMFLSGILSMFSGKFEAESTATGALGSLLLFALLTVFVYIICDEERMDEETFALRNILVCAVMVQCFAPLHTLAMRMNYYFIIFIPMAVGNCLKYPRKRMYDVAKWGEVVIAAFFILYFCLGIYTSNKTGSGSLDSVPYIPFWALE